MNDFENNYNNDENIYEPPTSQEPIPSESYTSDRMDYDMSGRSNNADDNHGDRNQYHNQENQNGRYRYSAGDIPEPKVKKKSGGGWFVKAIASGLVFGIVAGVAIAGVSIVKNRVAPTSMSQVEVSTMVESSKGNSSSAVTSQDVSKVVDNVMPSVVSITSTIESTSFYGTQESEGAGSGFIISKTDKKLLIATNNHVVSGSKSLTVGFCDGKTAPAQLVGTDTSADLAVISVKAEDVSKETASTIKIATLGDSDKLKVGQSVIAIGNALGYGQSVTTGVVSAKNREVSFTDGTMTLLQTDAAINPGNSGGVLVNQDGEVIGINNAKLEDTSVEGMGYAIPITTAKTILNELMNAGTINEKDSAFLGVIGRTIDSNYSQALGLPNGIYVSQVISGSPAEKAGINAGDVITQFEGNNVSTMEGLKEKLSRKKANTKVTITVKRANQNGNYEEKQIKVTLGKKSDFKDVSTEDNTNQNGQSNDNSQNNQNGGNGGYYYDNGNNSNGVDPFEYFFGNGGRYYNNGNNNY